MRRMMKSKQGRVGSLAVMLFTLVTLNLMLMLYTGYDTSANQLLLWVANPQNFLDNPIISFLIVSFTLAAFITIPLTGFLKSEFPIYAGIGIIFLGTLAIANDYFQHLCAQGYMGCTIGGDNFLLGFFVFGPFMMMFLFSLLEWMRGRD